MENMQTFAITKKEKVTNKNEEKEQITEYAHSKEKRGKKKIRCNMILTRRLLKNILEELQQRLKRKDK